MISIKHERKDGTFTGLVRRRNKVYYVT